MTTVMPGRTIEVAVPQPFAEAVVPDRHDRYDHYTFREGPYPALTESAWRIHAEGYHAMGFVNAEAIGEDGTLPPDIDKSRGPNTEYHLAYNPADRDKGVDEPKDRATMRIIGLPEGGTYVDLPAYRMCRDTLSDMGETLLANIQHADIRLKEIAALAKTEHASPLAVHEIFRKVIQDAMGKDEVWFFSIVSTTYDSLADSFGKNNFVVIGEDTPIDDSRVNPDITLKPTLLYPDTFIDNILISYQRAESPVERTRLLRSFMYFTDGLDPQMMSDEVRDARAAVLASQVSRATPASGVVTTGARDAGLAHIDGLLTAYAHQPEEWTPANRFNLAFVADREDLERRFERGEVTSVHDAVEDIANDLFEVRHPDKKDDADLRAQFVGEILAQGSEFGRWVLFPTGQLVRYPEMADLRLLRTSRNRDLITREEQARLYDATIAVFGMSVGSSVLKSLVASGIGGKLIMGDMDRLSPSNLNRIDVGFAHVGESKVDIQGLKVSEVDPYIEQVHFNEGVTPDNLEAISAEKPQIIFEEVDDLWAKVALRMLAKRDGIPLVMATDLGDKVLVDIERHDLGNVKPFNGRISERLARKIYEGRATPADLARAKRRIIGIGEVATRMLLSVAKAEAGELPGTAQLDTTAKMGGALAALTAREILLGHDVPSGRRKHDARKTLRLGHESNPLSWLKALSQLIRASKVAV